MKVQQFFKKQMRLALAVILLSIFTLVFVISKIYTSLGPDGKNAFWGSFTLGLAAFLFLFSARLKKDALPQKKAESPPTSRAYQQLLDEVTRCSHELKKLRKWTIGCLLMGWIALLIGKWIGHPPYNHPTFAIPVFGIAFLAATKSWEQEHELDASTVKCILEGIALEKRQVRSRYFHDLASRYEGWGMLEFAFMRISPSIMILFSLFNTGPLYLLADCLSEFVPNWVVYSGSGAVLAMAGLFLGRIACKHYQWLLWKLKESSV